MITTAGDRTVLEPIKEIIGAAADDVLIGTSADERIVALAGDDRIDAGPGDDLLIVDPVVDTLADESDGDVGAGALSLREAIALATPGSTITFAETLRDGTITLALGQLEIAQSLTIDGAGGITVDAAGASRVFSVDDRDDSAVQEVTFAGLTISGGLVSSTYTTVAGGAIRALGEGVVSLTNSTVSSSSASSAYGGAKGGGVYAQGDVVLEGSLISNNTATDDGAGVHAGGNLFVANSTISNNRSLAYYGSGSGGGLLGLGTVDVVGSIIHGNEAGEGAGVFGESVTLTNSTISDNFASSSSARGAGVAGTVVALVNSAVTGNHTGSYGSFSDASGAGVYGQTITLTNSTVSNNASSSGFAEGGGISGGAVTLTNSTISDNFAFGSYSGYGGGIKAETVTLTNSTVTGNSASGFGAYSYVAARGGGIDAAGTVALQDSIVLGNRAF